MRDGGVALERSVALCCCKSKGEGAYREPVTDLFIFSEKSRISWKLRWSGGSLIARGDAGGVGLFCQVAKAALVLL